MAKFWISCIFLVSTVMISSPSLVKSAEIIPVSPHTAGFRLVGEIKPGSYRDVIGQSISLGHDTGPEYFWLDSPGGDVREAMRLGRLARQQMMRCTVFEDSQCNSACFLIVAGCVDRNVSSVGLHRPTFTSQEFGQLSFSEAETSYKALLQEVQEYLRLMGISDTVIDIMSATPSSSMRVLRDQDLRDLIGAREPSYDEWLKSRCGTISDQEEKDSLLLTGARLWESHFSVMDPDTVNPAYRADFHHARSAYETVSSFSQGYKDYLGNKRSEISRCEMRARDEAAAEHWSSIRSSRNPD